MTVIDRAMMGSRPRSSDNCISMSTSSGPMMKHSTRGATASRVSSDMDDLMMDLSHFDALGGRPSMLSSFRDSHQQRDIDRNRKIDWMLSPGSANSMFQTPTRTSCRSLMDSSTRTDITHLQSSFNSLSSFSNNEGSTSSRCCLSTSNDSFSQSSTSPTTTTVAMTNTTASTMTSIDATGRTLTTSIGMSSSSSTSSALDVSQSNSTIPTTIDDGDDSNTLMSRSSSVTSIRSLPFSSRQDNKPTLPFLQELMDYVFVMSFGGNSSGSSRGSNRSFSNYTISSPVRDDQLKHVLKEQQERDLFRMELKASIEASIVRRLKRRARVLPYKLRKQQLELYRHELMSKSREAATMRRRRLQQQQHHLPVLTSKAQNELKLDPNLRSSSITSLSSVNDSDRSSRSSTSTSMAARTRGTPAMGFLACANKKQRSGEAAFRLPSPGTPGMGMHPFANKMQHQEQQGDEAADPLPSHAVDNKMQHQEHRNDEAADPLPSPSPKAEDTVATAETGGHMLSSYLERSSPPMNDIIRKSRNRCASFSSMSFTANDADDTTDDEGNSSSKGDNASLQSGADISAASSISGSAPSSSGSGSYLDGDSDTSIDTRLLSVEQQSPNDMPKMDGSKSASDDGAKSLLSEHLQSESAKVAEDSSSLEESSYQLSTAAYSNYFVDESDNSIQGSWMINFLSDENVFGQQPGQGSDTEDSDAMPELIDNDSSSPSLDGVEEEEEEEDVLKANTSRDDSLDQVFNTIYDVLHRKKLAPDARADLLEESNEDSSSLDDNASDSPCVRGINYDSADEDTTYSGRVVNYADMNESIPSRQHSEGSNDTLRARNTAKVLASGSYDGFVADTTPKRRQLRLPEKKAEDAADDSSEDSLDVLVDQRFKNKKANVEQDSGHASDYNIAPAFDAKQKKAALRSILKKVTDVDNDDEGSVGDEPSLIDQFLQVQSPEQGRPGPYNEHVGSVIPKATKSILKRPSKEKSVVREENDVRSVDPIGTLANTSRSVIRIESEYSSGFSSSVTSTEELEEPYRQELENYFATSKFKYYDHTPEEFAWSEVIMLSQLGAGAFGDVFKVIGNNKASYHVASGPRGDNCYALKCVKRGEEPPEVVPSFVRCLLGCTGSTSELAYEASRLRREQEDEILRAHYERCRDLALEAYLLSQMSHENIVSLRGISSEYSYVNPFCSHAFAFSSVSPSEKRDRGFFLLMDLLEDDTLQDRLINWRMEERQYQKAVYHQRHGDGQGNLKALWRRMIGKKASTRKPTRSSSLTSRPCIMERLDTIGLGIAKGLQHVHQNEVVFRDLKPSNVGFNAADGRVQIFDFGKAREQHMADMNERGDAGAPRYADVDAIIGTHFGPENDVYSFAMVLWEVCTLQIPYPDKYDEDGWCYKKKSLWKKLKKSLLSKTKKKSSMTEDENFLVMKQSTRPSFRALSASNAPIALEYLIRDCWSTVYQDRPTMDDVVSSMQNIIEGDRMDNIQMATIKNIKPILKKLSSQRKMLERVPENDGSEEGGDSDGARSPPQGKKSISIEPQNARRATVPTEQDQRGDAPRRTIEVGSGTTPPRLLLQSSVDILPPLSQRPTSSFTKKSSFRSLSDDSVGTEQTNDITLSSFGDNDGGCGLSLSSSTNSLVEASSSVTARRLSWNSAQSAASEGRAHLDKAANFMQNVYYKVGKNSSDAYLDETTIQRGTHSVTQ